jgi:LCP family protein required for cell wall assembly
VPSRQKPYRVYRGGRARGPIKPLSPSAEREQPPSVEQPGAAYPYPGYGPPSEPEYPGYPPARPPRRRGRRIALWVGIVLLVLALLVVGWGLAGFFSFRSGVKDANARLPDTAKAALTPREGALLSSPSNILLIGADKGPGRDDQGRSDSLVLVRTDPDHHRLALLSIPRDLRVEIPGIPDDKINAAYAYGGPALTIETVEKLTRLPVNHVVVVDFSTFADLIDALGGITVDVPKRIVSNRFDCPYGSQAACERWPGWRFRPGRQELDGRRALVYSRIRENQLDPSENDLTRGGRQQQVVQAIADEVVSVGGFLRLPFIGDDIARPLATDLSASDLMKLGWVKFRASDEATLRCRLGGTPQEIDGVWYLLAAEENVSVLDMVTGRSAPQPPPPDSGLYGPGCEAGT